MTAFNFVGNCSTVDWDTLIKDLENHVPRFRPPTNSNKNISKIEK